MRTASASRPASGGAWLATHARAWSHAGLVTPEQAYAIVRYEARRDPLGPATSAGPEVPPLIEVFADLAGVVALLGTAAWVLPSAGDPAPAAVRLVVAIVFGLVTAAIGMRLGAIAGRAGVRMRAVFWALTAAAGAAFAGVLADQVAHWGPRGEGALAALLAVLVVALLLALAAERRLADRRDRGLIVAPERPDGRRS